MALSRKNYVMLAETINASIQDIRWKHGSDSAELNTIKSFLDLVLLPKLCSRLKADNYAFSAGRFMEACLKDK